MQTTINILILDGSTCCVEALFTNFGNNTMQYDMQSCSTIKKVFCLHRYVLVKLISLVYASEALEFCNAYFGRGDCVSLLVPVHSSGPSDTVSFPYPYEHWVQNTVTQLFQVFYK